MKTCACKDPHDWRRVVLTGGPGAGKTAVLELIRQSFCVHVKVLPEAAGIVFGGGFPRDRDAGAWRAAQRAIFFVQRELEATADAAHPAIVLCDRGTVDGAAYWPGPGDLWSSVGTSLDEQLRRYHAVIHLRTPPTGQGYNHQNPLRIESSEEAAAIDERIAAAWVRHPRRFTVEADPDFLDKARRALSILREQMPECCRGHVVPSLDLPPTDDARPRSPVR
jgi:predicted ATPase